MVIRLKEIEELIKIGVYKISPNGTLELNLPTAELPITSNNLTIVRVDPEPGEIVENTPVIIDGEYVKIYHYITVWVEPTEVNEVRAHINIITPQPEHVIVRERIPAYIPDEALGFRWDVYNATPGIYTVTVDVTGYGDFVTYTWSYVIEE